MLSFMETFMLAKLALEVLAFLPRGLGLLSSAIAELKSSDTTGEKVAKLAKAAADIADALK